MQSSPPELMKRFDADSAADLIAAVGWSWAIEEVRGAGQGGGQGCTQCTGLFVPPTRLGYGVLATGPQGACAALTHPATGTNGTCSASSAQQQPLRPPPPCAGDGPRGAAAEAEGGGGQDHGARCDYWSPSVIPPQMHMHEWRRPCPDIGRCSCPQSAFAC